MASEDVMWGDVTGKLPPRPGDPDFFANKAARAVGEKAKNLFRSAPKDGTRGDAGKVKDKDDVQNEGTQSRFGKFKKKLTGEKEKASKDTVVK